MVCCSRGRFPAFYSGRVLDPPCCALLLKNLWAATCVEIRVSNRNSKRAELDHFPNDLPDVGVLCSWTIALHRRRDELPLDNTVILRWIRGVNVIANLRLDGIDDGIGGGRFDLNRYDGPVSPPAEYEHEPFVGECDLLSLVLCPRVRLPAGRGQLASGLRQREGVYPLDPTDECFHFARRAAIEAV